MGLKPLPLLDYQLGADSKSHEWKRQQGGKRETGEFGTRSERLVT